MLWLNLQHLWLKIMFLYLKWQQQPSNYNYFFLFKQDFFKCPPCFFLKKMFFPLIPYAQWLFINCRWFCWKSSDNIDKCFWCWSCWWRTCYIKCFFFFQHFNEMSNFTFKYFWFIVSFEVFLSLRHMWRRQHPLPHLHKWAIVLQMIAAWQRFRLQQTKCQRQE